MILGTAGTASPQQGQHRLSIDEIFHRSAVRQPDVLALVDPLNRETFTEGAPRRLSYAEADRVVSALAGRLRHMGMPIDSVVGIQLPNTVEYVLTLLGVLRAGLIAAPLPLLWRRADAVAALARVGAKALITCGRAGGFNHCQLAMRVASDIFSIRYVCGFGPNLPDGVVALDDLFGIETPDPVPALESERYNAAAAQVALISFDVGGSGIVPVARNHIELLAGGLAVTSESRLAQREVILSTIPPASFAGVAQTLLPWLLSAGTLVLHHPFAPQVLIEQVRAERCTTLVLPGAVAAGLDQTQALAGHDVGCIIAPWRAPDRLAASRTWRQPHIALVDVSIFGEAGLIAARRADDGRPAPIAFGQVVAPRDSINGTVVAELQATPASTVALRGAMVPRYAFPPGIERSGLPHFRIDRGGWVDTGYACRVDPQTKAMVVTGPPSAIVAIGGYRFLLDNLQEAVRRIDSSATLVALPDPVIGQRLIGNTVNREVVSAALNAVGANPLLAAAFTDRSARAEPAHS